MTIGQAVDRLFKRDAEAWGHAHALLVAREASQTHLVVPEALFFRLVALACTLNGYSASLGTVLTREQLEDACAHLDVQCEDVATTLLLSRRLYGVEYTTALEQAGAEFDPTDYGLDSSR